MSVGFGRIKFVLEEEGGGGSFPEHGVVCYLCGVHAWGWCNKRVEKTFRRKYNL